VACAPGTSTCIDAKTRNTCDASGAWTIATDCSMQGSDGQTCVGTVCTGECAQDRVQCDGQTPEVCSSSGSWVQNGNSCVTPDFVCNSGACAANPVYTLASGRDASEGGTARTLVAGRIYATRVQTGNDPVALIELGLRGQATGGGGKVALYADVVTANGNHYPGARLAYGIESAVITAATNRYLLPNVGNLVLEPNTTYWVAAMTSSDAHVFGYGSPNDYEVRWAPAGVPFSSSPPPTFPTSGLARISDLELSLFIRVQRVP
jgi:hypothetical protein